ncbi:hypothetical protein AVEN_29424-1 [Araneus ventricosus]|uniref:Peptidase A2 domain-containing protein n=1 Tax=Araneus ventricosus TaxID=182803 RepID=A0A4Y2CYM1_ARAVE|nr:hypothetical protein AVEN_29424-1 [Araneus ventricosus]
MKDCSEFRLFVLDRRSNLHFLLDSGADVSIIPATSQNKKKTCGQQGGCPSVINYELAFIADDSSVSEIWHANKWNFSKSYGHGFPGFAKREEVFVMKRLAFLPQDTMTARCRIWKSTGEMAEDVHCIVRTRIGVEKRSILWNVGNFSTLESGKKYTYKIKSLAHDKQLMSVNISLTEGLGSEEIICFELNLQDQAIKLSTLQLSLVDISGSRIECNTDEFWLNDPSKSKEFKFFFTKNKLMAMKNLYLHDDILSLHWEWAFSKGEYQKKLRTSNMQVAVLKINFLILKTQITTS